MAERQIPGGAFINEDEAFQRQIPGSGFINRSSERLYEDTITFNRDIKTQPNNLYNLSALGKKAYFVANSATGNLLSNKTGLMYNAQPVAVPPSKYFDGVYLYGRSDGDNNPGRYHFTAIQPPLGSIKAFTYVIKFSRTLATNFSGNWLGWGNAMASQRNYIVAPAASGDLTISVRQAEFDISRTESYSAPLGKISTWCFRVVTGIGIETFVDGILKTPSSSSGTMPSSYIYSSSDSYPIWMGTIDVYGQMGGFFGSALWFEDLGSETARNLSKNLYSLIYNPSKIIVPNNKILTAPVLRSAGASNIGLSGFKPNVIVE